MSADVVNQSSGIPSSYGGRYCGSSHWLTLAYQSHQKKTNYIVFADTSVTVQFRGRAVHPIYLEKEVCVESFYISTACIIATPFYAVAAVVYHVFRIVIIPFYLIIMAIVESCKAEKGKKGEAAWNQIKVIPYEMGISIWMAAIATPIFAVGVILGHLCTLLDPSRLYRGDSLNGRKIAGNMEFLWNRAIPLAEGTWLGDRQDWFQSRNGAYPFYMAGCYQSQGCYDPNTNQVFMYSKDKKNPDALSRDRDSPPYTIGDTFDWQSCWPCCMTIKKINWAPQVKPLAV